MTHLSCFLICQVVILPHRRSMLYIVFQGVLVFSHPKQCRLDEHFIHLFVCFCLFFMLEFFQRTFSNHYVSQFTVETYCFADGRCLFKQPQSVLYHWNQYDEEISKKCRSVRPSVCPFVTLTKKLTPPSLLIVER